MTSSSTSFSESTTDKKNQGKIEIIVSNLRSGNGKIAISIFPKEQLDGFPGKAERAIETFYLDLNGSTSISLTSKSLPFGEYAIALMHDENGDGQFATTLFGIPKDGFGFSRNPRILFGAPKFSACAFSLKEDRLEIPVSVKYFL